MSVTKVLQPSGLQLPVFYDHQTWFFALLVTIKVSILQPPFIYDQLLDFLEAIRLK